MKVTINQQEFDYQGDPSMPLLWFIRDELKMTGTKYSCGMALCGACTVHLDGEPTRSCQLPMAAIGDKAVTTIEGLSEDGSHPVQQAWREHNLPQCGYCQSGQMMQAASLVDKQQPVTDEQIESHMSGNICRCGTYPRIRAAVKSAAESIAVKVTK